MKKVLLALFLSIIFINTINAIEMCTPSDEYLKYMELSDEEKQNYIEPPYCKTIEEEKNVFSSIFDSINNAVYSSFTDSSYNAFNDGLINTSGNQGNLGTCWAFSSISAVEANAKKNGIGSYNFSEAHMIYSTLSAAYSDNAGKVGKYYTTNLNGGKVTYAASYYLNGTGQLLDSELRYTDQMTPIKNSEYKKGKQMISLGGFTLANLGNYSTCSSNEITYIKKQIIAYGSVQVSMYMDELLFKDSSNNYYISKTTDSSLPNHGVSIIGWDDNISASKFDASRNGAWIIKNSWGPNWSDDGLFYISYDDHFICKNIATFYKVSKTTFDNTYASADVLGVPSFTFNGDFYTSAKFTKKTSSAEDLKRVSFPTGENTKYYVYLVTDNNIKNQSGWTLLTNGTSSNLGIESVNLNNITLYDDFTIVVKYNTSSSSTVFTMCNNVDDTSRMTYSSNTNFFSTNASVWYDLYNISINNTSISCEPNIYVYTNDIQVNSNGSVNINSITQSSDKFTVSITKNNVNTNGISYVIYDSSNNNVTSHFTITPNYDTDKVVIKSDGKVSGKFTFVIRYSNSESSINFELVESVISKDSTFIKISSNKMNVFISNNYTLTYEKLLNGLNIKNTSVKIINTSGNAVTSNTSVVTTNYKIKTNENTYTIIIIGDVNADGKITALDYIEVRKHIMGSTISDSGKLLAGDVDQNNKITALDYIAIRKILMR